MRLLQFRPRRYGAWSGLRTAQADSRMSGTCQIASDREARLGESGHGFAGISAVRAAHMRSIGADDGGRDCACAPWRDPLIQFPPPDCSLDPAFDYAKIPSAKQGAKVLLRRRNLKMAQTKHAELSSRRLQTPVRGATRTFSQLLCGCALILAATTASAGEADRIRRGTPYADARKALLADGFVPARIGACSGPGRKDICISFPEAQMCAGTGFAECVFVFRRPDGGTLRIVTRGEELKDLSVYRIMRGRSGNRGRPRR
jgi:hypothetical protein